MSIRWASLMALLLVMLASSTQPRAADADETALRKAVTFYASFDDAVKGDFGGGELLLSTRSNHPTEKGQVVIEKGFNDKVFRIAKDKGISGGCLEVVDVLPNNGRVFFPCKGNIAFKKGGWGGALSVWIKTNPDTMLKTKFCDPIQITQKGAGNGGIWFDFNDSKPRDMRHGAFPVIPEGKTGIKEEDPAAPMVRVPKVGFKADDWHHIVLSWKNFDTGKKDANSALYIDGKLIGEIKDYDIGMDWDIDKAGIYVAVNYIGLLDELALFDRALTAEEVNLLKSKPGLLVPLKADGEARAQEIIRRAETLLRLYENKDVTREGWRDVSHLVQLLANEPGYAERSLALRLRVPDPRWRNAPVSPKFPFDAATARRYQEDYAKQVGLPLEFTNSLGMTFRLVPPGTFLMGSPENEPGHNSGGYDETLHPVTLTRPFYLSKHETTVGQFRRFVEATSYVTDVEKAGGGNAHDDKADWKHRPGTQWRKPGFAGPFELKDEHPVVHVSHTDCKNFCKWLQERAGTNGVMYDLPTEAQWEWACRAGSAARFSWGPDEDTTGKVANVGDRSLKKVHPDWPRAIMAMDDGHGFLAPVGSYQANGFGLHDMLGNCWEFCSTHYGPYPKEPVTDPGDGDPKRGFAVRGGGWSNVPNDARCASRNADPPHFGHSNLGFRVALQLPSPRK